MPHACFAIRFIFLVGRTHILATHSVFLDVRGYGLGPLTQSTSIGDQREADGIKEHHVETLKSREDLAVAVQAPERTSEAINFLLYVKSRQHHPQQRRS